MPFISPRLSIFMLVLWTSVVCSLSWVAGTRADSASGVPPTQTQTAAQPPEPPNGGELYAKYCSTCHGPNGEGHLTERANSLRSSSFLNSVSYYFVDHAVRYGRAGTAMAGYSVAVGGPLKDDQITAIVKHIEQFSRVNLQGEVNGDPARGAKVYAEHCVRCHGPDGKGISAPSINDPLFLYTAEPLFLRYAIAEGRDNTAMPAFRHTLAPQQIDDVVAHIQSWGTPWLQPEPVRVTIPSLDDRAVLNPKGASPDLGTLREGRYVTAATLKRALDSGTRLVLLDVRATSAWAAQHISGSVPLPYHDIEDKIGKLPNDGTWIVAYCACPTHLSDLAVDALRRKGYRHTATLDGGLAAWIAQRYPLQAGTIVDGK